MLHMYIVFNLKISKEKVENDLAAHTFGHICFVWGQRGDVVASDEIFSFRNSFHTISRIFLFYQEKGFKPSLHFQLESTRFIMNTYANVVFLRLPLSVEQLAKSDQHLEEELIFCAQPNPLSQ